MKSYSNNIISREEFDEVKNHLHAFVGEFQKHKQNQKIWNWVNGTLSIVGIGLGVYNLLFVIYNFGKL